MGEFTNTPSIFQLIGSDVATTSITITDTFYPITIPTNTTTTFAGNSIGLIGNNEFSLNENGIFVFQWMMACSGGANASYTITLVNTTEGIPVPHTEVSFTTKGSGMWEVQNMFLINNKSTRFANTNTSFYTEKQSYVMHVKNNTGVANFDIENLNIIVYKLN